MKAIVYTQYGSPDVLQLKEIAKPEPKDDQVIIKIHAASANALDYRRFGYDTYHQRLVCHILVSCRRLATLQAQSTVIPIANKLPEIFIR